MTDREKVIRGLECCAYGSLSDCERCPYYTKIRCSEDLCADALALLKEQEAVKPKRSTGWWMPGDYVATEHGECVTYPGEGITCSNCHYGFKGRFLWSREYCPHCGAKMEEEADDAE